MGALAGGFLASTARRNEVTTLTGIAVVIETDEELFGTIRIPIFNAPDGWEYRESDNDEAKKELKIALELVEKIESVFHFDKQLYRLGVNVTPDAL